MGVTRYKNIDVNDLVISKPKKETPEVKIKTRPKPEETRHGPEYFSQRNIFTEGTFDIEKFNNFFENSKKDDTNTVAGKTYENIDVLDFDQVDNYQPINEYGGVAINDLKVDTSVIYEERI